MAGKPVPAVTGLPELAAITSLAVELLGVTERVVVVAVVRSPLTVMVKLSALLTALKELLRVAWPLEKDTFCGEGAEVLLQLPALADKVSLKLKLWLPL